MVSLLVSRPWPRWVVAEGPNCTCRGQYIACAPAAVTCKDASVARLLVKVLFEPREPAHCHCEVVVAVICAGAWVSSVGLVVSSVSRAICTHSDICLLLSHIAGQPAPAPNCHRCGTPATC